MPRKREIWHPPLYEQADMRAIQAIAEGVASPEDQKRGLDWIVMSACATYEDPFTPGQSDVRDYILGRRSVGLAIVKMMKLKVGILFDPPDEETKPDQT